jgi:hypothetical protein
MTMSDIPDIPYQPALVSAIRARNLARIYKGLAVQLRAENFTAEARLAENDSQWWLNYAIALSQIPPGAIDPNESSI